MSVMFSRSLATLGLSALAALSLGATGCFGTPYPNPGPGPGTQIIVGTGAAAPNFNATPVSLIAGGVGNIDPGTAGYIITANAGSFRFTWTGYAEFRGSIFAAPNAYGTLTAGCIDGACSLASGEDVIRVSPNEPGRIDFVSFPASGKRSGFDVEILSNQVWIDLLVDGVRQPRLTLFAGVDPQTGQPFQASAATMPLSLQVALPRAQSLPGAENAKVVAAPAPATTTKETRDPSQVGAKILALPGQDTAQITGAEGLLNFRGRGDQADATR